MTLKAQVTKEKLDLVDFIKMTKFCDANNTIKKMGGEP